MQSHQVAWTLIGKAPLSPRLYDSGTLARKARSRAPWVKKCGKLPIRENLVIT